MKPKVDVQPNNEVISPEDRLVKAFDELAAPIAMEHSEKRVSILKNHKMQLRSADVEADHPRTTVVMETDQGFAIHTTVSDKTPSIESSIS